MLQVDDLVGALTNRGLIFLNFQLSCRYQSLCVQKLIPQVLHLANDRLVLLVDRGLLPAGKHNDEIELADTLLGSTF